MTTFGVSTTDYCNYDDIFLLIIGHHVEHSDYNIQSCWCGWLLGYLVMGHHVASASISLAE